MSDQGSKMEKYFLHYVGRGLYSIEDFVIESEKYGVNRALPTSIIKNMKFGDKILLAQYVSEKRDPDTNELLKPGKAIVFGYYVIGGLNFDSVCLPEFQNRLEKQLDIVKSISESGKPIRRKCGSYSIGVTHIVRNELDDIMEKVENLEKEMKIKVKTFVSGHFYQMALKVITPIRFSRTGLYIKINKKLESDEIKNHCIGFIGNYKQRKYFLKREIGIKKIYEFVD